MLNAFRLFRLNYELECFLKINNDLHQQPKANVHILRDDMIKN